MTIQRIQWTCPICKRRYAIPATAPTPSRCPQCRQAEEEAASRSALATPLAEAVEEPDDELENSALSALAAIQLEVAEEAARGPTMAAPVLRHAEEASNMLRNVALAYTVLAGFAVVVAFAGLLYGLHAAFAMPATHERAVLIFLSIGAFVGGLIAGFTFFTFHQVIRVLLAIEENTKPR